MLISFLEPLNATLHNIFFILSVTNESFGSPFLMCNPLTFIPGTALLVGMHELSNDKKYLSDLTILFVNRKFPD